MSEGIYIGTRKTTDEERAEIERGWYSGNTGGSDLSEPGGGYYSGHMGQPANEPAVSQSDTGKIGGALTAVNQPEPEPQPSTAWIAQPENFMSVWSKYDQDPDYQDEHYSRQQMDMLYNVYSSNNPGVTPDRWKPLMDNDPYLTGEILKNNWWDPVKEEQAAQQAAQQSAEVYRSADPNKQGWYQEKETGDWNNLGWIGKAFTAVSTSDNDLANQPGWVKKTQAGQQALSSAMALPAALKIGGAIAGAAGAGGAAAALTNPYVLLAAGVGMAGLTFYEAVSGKEMPAFDKFREISDIVDTTVEHTIGFGTQAVNMTKERFAQAKEDPDDTYGLLNAISDSFKDVFSQARSMWQAGEYTYEMYGSVGDFAIDALKQIFEGEEGTKTGEGWFFNRGINEKQQLAEGTYGSEGMQQILELFREMDEAGIDKDIQSVYMNELVNRAGGTSAFVSDYSLQMLLDADILLTPMENTAAKAVMKATGNDLGVQAANINSGNVLTQLPVVGPMIQAAGQKAPGGIFEFMDVYKNLARTQDVSTLSAADRFFGGINADGTIKDFARTEKTGLKDMLPDSKVTGVGDIANKVMSTFLYDAQDTNDIRNRLASMAGEANKDTAFRIGDSGFENSAEVLTVRDGIRYAINESNPEIYLQQYDNSADARATLQKAADALGMEVQDVIELYSEKPSVFEQRVKDYAAEHNGLFADIDVSAGVDPISTIVKGFTTAKDGKGTPLAWNIKQVQAKITNAMIDSMAQYYTEYYGVQPNSTINTAFDTMKSAQSLLLLGWSPSYFINNVVNNFVTSAAEGVLGFMTPRQIRQWMEAFGVKPSRMDVDINAEFRGQSVTGEGGLEKFSEAVSKKKKEGTDKGINGALSGINDALRKANNKLGVFSSLSGKMETLQGNQLTAVAIQQYWGRRWKRGEGFHLLPDQLVQRIETQSPGMTDIIYQAIESGLNMDQVKKILFDNYYVKPDVVKVMKDLCAEKFPGDANVYEEVFVKSGIMNEIRERFMNCKTDEERQAVMDSVKQKFNDYMDNMRREDLIQRANNVATVAESEGLAPVAQMMSEMEMNHQDFWIRIRREEGDIMTKTQEMDSREGRALKAEVFARHRKEFVDLYKQEISTAAGIMKGLGFQNESHAKYIGYMNENNQNWADFYEQKERELQRAYDRTEALDKAAGKGKKADSVQKREVWNEYHQIASDLYKDHFAKEMELSAKRDAAFIEGYEYATGKSGEQFRKNFERIREIRQQMYDMQQDAHNKTKDMTPEDKNAFYEQYNPKYNALIREIGNIGEANAQIIEDTAQNTPQTYENHAPVNMTPEQTVQATEIKETHDAIREQAMRERNGYLDRDGIRQGWIESGRTPAEADLMMTYFDAAADSWAKMNGMYPDEFYSQAVQLKGIARWLGEDRNKLDPNILNQSSEEFYKTELGKKIIEKTLTPEFEAWFRKSVRKDEAGKPQHIYHGSPALFFQFLREASGSKTGKSDTKDVFYVSKDRGTAASYGSNAPIWHRVGERFFAYMEGRIVPGGETNLWEQTKISSLSNPTIADVQTILQNIKDLTTLLNEYQEGFSENSGIDISIETEMNHLQSIIDKGTVGQNDVEYIRRAYFLDDSIRYAFGDTSRTSDVSNQYEGSGIVYEGYLRQENPLTVDYDSDEHLQYMLNEEYKKVIVNGREVIGPDGEPVYLLDENGNRIHKWTDPDKAKADINEWDGDWQAYKNEQARSTGHDGCEFLNVYDTDNGVKILTTTYTFFEPNQFKSIFNDGHFNNADNILHQQLQEIVKGTFEHSDIGNVIRMLNASDVSTMVHESGHLFRRTLSTPLLQEFTTWAGFENVGEFQELETRFWNNDPTLSIEDKARYEDAEEKFARGFEQYLMDGSAPTPGLKAVFKAFRDYLLDIYKKVKTTVTGNDYSGQGEFIFHGATGDEVLNINAEINGVKLRDIFDRMLTDDVQRTPGYAELVQNLRTQLGQDRHNMRMSKDALSRRAQVEVNRAILQNFGSMEEAESALQSYSLPMEINGWRVDDGTLFEAIRAAKADAQMNPFAQVDHHEVSGTNTYAYSIKNANSRQKYQMKYKVVELKDLIASDSWMGNTLVINENYPADYQARHRSADQSDVYSHAANLNPGLLIDEQHAIDSGTPIIGEGNLYVESGNGRVLSLEYAHDNIPEQWNNYQEYLRNSVGDYGIDPAQLDTFENPVLVRERMGGNSVEFAEDANSNRNKAMSASENALTDANKVNMVTLSNLDIQPGEGIDTFTTEKNAQPAVEWLRSLPEMERSRYSAMNRNGDLVLSADGKTRFTNALFATIYATPESMEIIKSFSETADSNIQALESALKQTLPEMARAEGLIQSGSRNAELSITADVMAAAGLLEDARKAGINIHDYLAQQTIPGFERWTPTQALLAGFFGDAKNNVRMLRDFFNAYGEEVYKSGDPNQLSLFGESKTREQMINDSLDAALNRGKSQESVVTQGTGTGVPESGHTEPVPMSQNGTPVLNQSSVMDSDGRWTSEFAKVLDDNLQRTFDDGMSIPLDQAESVYLKGEVNVKYETMVQRWLRDFSNNKNLTADQYLYAWGYMDWWAQGSNGEAPKGNPLWEAEVQKLVMEDFVREHSDMVNELQRRYKKGAEVDPGSVPNSGEYFKRTYEFAHGFWNIAGNVYKDGKLVAYLPEEIAKMQKTIDVDGQSYHVLGVDLQNPEGLVYYDPVLEIVRTVNVGKPEGFEEPRNPFAFIRPARQGSTPQTMPIADGYGELKTKYLDPILSDFLDKYKEADTDAKTAQMSGLDLQTRAEILKWMDQDVAEDMRIEKYRAMKYSDAKRDAAMLNYSQRYGFDPLLTMISPYQLWYTRSMWKWAKRMIDKPALGNAYKRLEEYEDRNRQENLPSRLSGKWRIPMPFLPDWMGGSYYVDLNAQLFPWTQFGQSYSSKMNAYTLNARTKEILEQQVQAGDITAEQMNDAVSRKEGEVWQNAYAEAETEIGTQNGLSTLASQFISPSIFITWAGKKQAGEDPGTLSSTRTGNAIRGLTQDIPLISGIGDAIGDVMALPEKALRKLYGFDYTEFGQYGDQQIRKQIAQMIADGEIDHVSGLNAMNEKTGTIWDMAADRQRKEAMLKVPGFAGAEAVKEMVKGNASITDAMGAIAMSLAGGGSIYPEGEKTLREMQALRDQAYIDEANGIKGAVSNWYDQYGDIYYARTAIYKDDPEELIKYTLYYHITQMYYAQPYAQQQEIKNELGPEFTYALLNKDTRNYEAVPIEKLAKWNAALGGTNPNVGSIDVKGVERVMRLSEPVIESVDNYFEERDRLYPGISIIQNGYYALPKDQRKNWISSFPQLEDYWEWNRQYKNDHPEYVRWNEERSAYYNEETCYNSYAEMSERTQQQLELNKATGKQMSSAAEWELRQLYAKYANENFLSYEDYIKLLQDWE